MRHDEHVRARAEQAFQQQSLAKLADGITDPQVRTQAHGIASGAISAAEFLRHMENSAEGMRGFDRYLTRFMTLGPADLERIATQREQRIDEIAAELLAEQTVTRKTADVPIEQDDPSWEDQSWLE
ncbi:MAG TPA: hypothetical protein VH333_21325 [Pseudonocardiaceae bacterium]|jgi:hypothetical protein|nr:hypothetical protein [Pseudonocardiaceae bacterium]